MEAVETEPGSISSELARFATDLHLDIPESAMEASARIILDTIACVVAAAQTPQAAPVRALKLAQGGAPQSTLIPSGERVPIASAAYVHAQLANVLDADETLFNFGHFASVIVMPALALAEATGASGEDFVAAVAVGFDVAARVGVALPNNALSDEGVLVYAANRGFSWAALGTAAAAARLLHLDSQQMEHALGTVMATTPVHGVLERNARDLPGSPAFASWHKYAMYGAIAEAGVNAAILAQAGFLADNGALDPANEPFRAFGADHWFPERITAELGRRWFIEETSIKAYPFCRYAAGALDLFKSIVDDEDLRPQDIERINVTVAPFEALKMIIDRPLAAHHGEIMISLRYAFWMIVNRVPPGPEWWAIQQVDTPEAEAFAGTIGSSIRAEWRHLMLAELDDKGFFLKVPVEVTVECRNGTVFTLCTEYAIGDPWTEKSAMSDDELAGKVRSFTVAQLGTEGTYRLLQAAQALRQAPTVEALVAGMLGSVP